MYELNYETGNDWIDKLKVKDQQHAIKDAEYVIIEPKRSNSTPY